MRWEIPLEDGVCIVIIAGKYALVEYPTQQAFLLKRTEDSWSYYFPKDIYYDYSDSLKIRMRLHGKLNQLNEALSFLYNKYLESLMTDERMG